jgi:hypothetical protein
VGTGVTFGHQRMGVLNENFLASDRSSTAATSGRCENASTSIPAI